MEEITKNQIISKNTQDYLSSHKDYPARVKHVSWLTLILSLTLGISNIILLIRTFISHYNVAVVIFAIAFLAIGLIITVLCQLKTLKGKVARIAGVTSLFVSTLTLFLNELINGRLTKEHVDYTPAYNSSIVAIIIISLALALALIAVAVSSMKPLRMPKGKFGRLITTIVSFALGIGVLASTFSTYSNISREPIVERGIIVGFQKGSSKTFYVPSNYEGNWITGFNDNAFIGSNIQKVYFQDETVIKNTSFSTKAFSYSDVSDVYIDSYKSDSIAGFANIFDSYTGNIHLTENDYFRVKKLLQQSNNANLKTLYENLVIEGTDNNPCIIFEDFDGSYINPAYFTKGDKYGDVYSGSRLLSDRNSQKFLGWEVVGENRLAGEKETFSKTTVLRAKWTDIYTVTYLDTKTGGYVLANDNVQHQYWIGEHYKEGKGTIKLPGAEKVLSFTGYTHNKWQYIVNGSSKSFNLGDTVDTSTLRGIGDILFQSVWEANKYTITFNPNGGTLSDANTKTVTYDSKVGALPNVTKVGYVFDGWFTSGDVKITAELVWAYAENVTVTAHWTAKTYTLNFIANGGVGDTAAMTITYDQAYELPTLTRIGYDSYVWKMADDSIFPKSGVCNIDDVNGRSFTLSAIWTPHTYTITFNSNLEGVTFSTSSIDAVFNENISALASVTATKPGYHFVRWEYNGETYTSTSEWTTPSDATFTAIMEANTYKVVANYDGGTPSGTVPTTLTYCQPYTLPTATKTGYDFVSWKLNGSTIASSGICDYIAENNANVNLSIAWSAHTYTVTLDVNGGELSTTQVSVTYDSSYTLPSPTKTGYTFKGWEREDTSTTVPTTGTWTIAQNATLKAVWEANTYTAFLVDQSVSENAYDTIQVTYDQPYILPVLTKTGYTFTGWKESVTGTIIVESNNNWNYTTDVTFYAIWAAKSYGVQLNANGGTFENGSDRIPLIATFDQVVSGMKDYIPTKTGYTFAGWYLEDQLINADVAWKYDNESGSFVLLAKWTANQYVATFIDPANSFEQFTKTYTYDEEFVYPTRERNGYIFTGWVISGIEDSTTYLPGANSVWTFDHNVVFEATWLGYSSSLHLCPNGGTFASGRDVEIFDVRYGDKLSGIEEYNPTKTGYTFVGWHLEENDKTYTSKDVWDNHKNSSGAVYNLYASWDAKKYTVTLNYNDEVTENESIEVTYDSTVGEVLPENPVREGYTFSGWYYGDELITKNTVWQSDVEDIVFTARWTAVE